MSELGQRSLKNFYLSVQFRDPRLAALISEDVMEVAINSIALDIKAGQPAADRLREKSRDLPVLMVRLLDKSLKELGYS